MTLTWFKPVYQSIFILGIASLGFALSLNHADAQTEQAQPPVNSRQNLELLTNEVNRLKSDLLLLQRQVYQKSQTGNAVPATSIGVGNQSQTPSEPMQGSVAGRLQIGIQQLETAMRNMNGRMEEIEFKLLSLAQQLDGFNRDIQFRLDRLEGVGGTNINETQMGGDQTRNIQANQAPLIDSQQGTPNSLGTLIQDEQGNIIASEVNPNSMNSSPEETDSAADTALLSTPKASYDLALSSLNLDRDYQKAEALFKGFLQAWPEDKLAGNARYWLGETYYAQSLMDDAVKAFIDTYTNYPDNPKAPAALYKLALSLDAIGRRPTACESLATLRQQYPQAEAYVLENGKNLETQYQCL
ncbi:MAG: tol-pal system protein YbgF [Alphaproteobacteria bacterium]